MKMRWLLMALGVSHLLATTSFAENKPVRPEQVPELLKLIKPARDEDRWATIPWLTDLTQARRLAAEQGKPILLWEMDGHPLGCT